MWTFFMFLHKEFFSPTEMCNVIDTTQRTEFKADQFPMDGKKGLKMEGFQSSGATRISKL